jgi:transcriptional regulator of acetoin/glycerol metabolism
VSAEPDIIETLLAMVRAEFPQCTESQAQHLDERIRAQWGGQRLHIAKTRHRKPGNQAKPAETLQRAYTDALGSEPTKVITTRHGISRATLYRLMKKGPPDTA